MKFSHEHQTGLHPGHRRSCRGFPFDRLPRVRTTTRLISLEVRQRIQQLAQEMGYTPNAVAQSLRGKRTSTVGLVITSMSDPFLGRVVRGIEDVAQAARVSVLLSVSNNDPEREMEVIETFHRRRVDGVISATAQIWVPICSAWPRSRCRRC